MSEDSSVPISVLVPDPEEVSSIFCSSTVDEPEPILVPEPEAEGVVEEGVVDEGDVEVSSISCALPEPVPVGVFELEPDGELIVEPDPEPVPVAELELPDCAKSGAEISIAETQSGISFFI